MTKKIQRQGASCEHGLQPKESTAQQPKAQDIVNNTCRDTSKLKKGTYIAFLWRYMPQDPMEIVVANITEAYDDHYLVHFLYGHHSISEDIKFQDIIAIGNHKGTAKLPGWHGKYTITKKVSQILPNCPACNDQRE